MIIIPLKKTNIQLYSSTYLSLNLDHHKFLHFISLTQNDNVDHFLMSEWCEKTEVEQRRPAKQALIKDSNLQHKLFRFSQQHVNLVTWL